MIPHVEPIDTESISPFKKEVLASISPETMKIIASSQSSLIPVIVLDFRPGALASLRANGISDLETFATHQDMFQNLNAVQDHITGQICSILKSLTSLYFVTHADETHLIRTITLNDVNSEPYLVGKSDIITTISKYYKYVYLPLVHVHDIITHVPEELDQMCLYPIHEQPHVSATPSLMKMKLLTDFIDASVSIGGFEGLKQMTSPSVDQFFVFKEEFIGFESKKYPITDKWTLRFKNTIDCMITLFRLIEIWLANVKSGGTGIPVQIKTSLNGTMRVYVNHAHDEQSDWLNKSLKIIKFNKNLLEEPISYSGKLEEPFPWIAVVAFVIVAVVAVVVYILFHNREKESMILARESSADESVHDTIIEVQHISGTNGFNAIHSLSNKKGV